MMIAFTPHGPFTVPVRNGGLDDELVNDFWEEVDEAQAGLAEATGCYVFGMRAGRGVRPWYVGKTDRASFKTEVFQDHKFRLYWKILNSVRKGTPLLYFIARSTSKGAFSRKKNDRWIGTLEELLIGTCLLRNSKLINKRSTKQFQLQIPGYMNESPGARSKQAKELAKLLGVAKNVVESNAKVIVQS